MDAACFLACSSASFSDKARAALRSGSSSSSATDPCVLLRAGSLFSCDCGTYPDVPIPPFDSSKLISNAFRMSSSKLLLGSTRALRGCILLALGAKDTLRSIPPPLPYDFLVSFS